MPFSFSLSLSRRSFLRLLCHFVVIRATCHSTGLEWWDSDKNRFVYFCLKLSIYSKQTDSKCEFSDIRVHIHHLHISFTLYWIFSLWLFILCTIFLWCTVSWVNRSECKADENFVRAHLFWTLTTNIRICYWFMFPRNLNLVKEKYFRHLTWTNFNKIMLIEGVYWYQLLQNWYYWKINLDAVAGARNDITSLNNLYLYFLLYLK